MNVEECKKRVDFIREIAWDDESAHGNEDQLHHDFIQHIANSEYGELSEMAKEILKTDDIDFERWCA